MISAVACVLIVALRYLCSNSFPLIPADIAFIDRPSYRPKPPDWRTSKTMCLDKSIPCAHKTMTLHTMMLSMTFTNNFCACQSSPFTDIRLICSVFVEFITSFFHVLTCFNGCVAGMDARLVFGTRLRWFCDCLVTVELGENEHFAVALGSGSDVD